MAGINRDYWDFQKRILTGIEAPQRIYEHCMRDLLSKETVWLDLGCGHKFCRNWKEGFGVDREKRMFSQCRHLFGIDYDMKSLLAHETIKDRTRGNIGILPYKNKSFNLVTSNMVLEHLKQPLQQLKEVWRVLKTNGLFLFHTPNVFSYTTIAGRLIPMSIKTGLIKRLQGRVEDDVFETHYKMNSEKRIIQLAKEAGFVLRDLKFLVDPMAKFANLHVLAVFELIYLRFLTLDIFKKLRTNIICLLEKRET